MTLKQIVEEKKAEKAREYVAELVSRSRQAEQRRLDEIEFGGSDDSVSEGS